MQSISRAIKRISILRAKPDKISLSIPATSIPQHELVDEELGSGYNFKHYYPAKPGEILANSYQLLVKVGWGAGSTVWLARDVTRYRWQAERLVALKIINNDNPEAAYRERDIEAHIKQQITSHRGLPVIRNYLDSFEVTGPRGKHLCLTYKPAREPLWSFQRRFEGYRFPLSMAKGYILILLAGLDYLHSQCRVVHTDLKFDNILVTFENENILRKFVSDQTGQHMQCKTNPDTGRVIYRCHNDFGPLDSSKLGNIYPQITDFSAAVFLGNNNHDNSVQLGTRPIQPDYYRAPEVVLGCGWGFSADIWNLGVMAWNIVEGTELFTQVQDAGGNYASKAHLAEMIALLGPPPKKLLVMSESMAQAEWSPAITDDSGKVHENNRDYFGGPFFDGEGKFLHDDLIPTRKLEDTVPSLDTGEREAFLSFIKQMLAWLPEERKTARELMGSSVPQRLISREAFGSSNLIAGSYASQY